MSLTNTLCYLLSPYFALLKTTITAAWYSGTNVNEAESKILFHGETYLAPWYRDTSWDWDGSLLPTHNFDRTRMCYAGCWGERRSLWTLQTMIPTWQARCVYLYNSGITTMGIIPHSLHLRSTSQERMVSGIIKPFSGGHRMRRGLNSAFWMNWHSTELHFKIHVHIGRYLLLSTLIGEALSNG